MQNHINEIIAKIAQTDKSLNNLGANTLRYDIYPKAQVGEEMLHLRLGDYLTVFTVCDTDIKMNAKIVRDKKEVTVLSDVIAHITAALYLEALKPYISKGGNVPVSIMPRAIREFFDMITIKLSTQHPDVNFTIVDCGLPARKPKLPARIQILHS